MPQFKFYLIVLLTLLVVSACSFFNPQLPKRDISLVSSSQRASVEVHLVQHAMGQTLVPVHPQRVVVIQRWLVQIPLALGYLSRPLKAMKIRWNTRLKNGLCIYAARY
jgi:ABC-type Fe3+-hydroxamate transport system substrate-binding protein